MGRRSRADPRDTDSRSGCRSAGAPHSGGVRGEKRRRSTDWAEVSSASHRTLSSANGQETRTFVTSSAASHTSSPPRPAKARPLEGPEQGHCAVKSLGVALGIGQSEQQEAPISPAAMRRGCKVPCTSSHPFGPLLAESLSRLVVIGDCQSSCRLPQAPAITLSYPKRSSFRENPDISQIWGISLG